MIHNSAGPIVPVVFPLVLADRWPAAAAVGLEHGPVAAAAAVAASGLGDTCRHVHCGVRLAATRTWNSELALAQEPERGPGLGPEAPRPS